MSPSFCAVNWQHLIYTSHSIYIILYYYTILSYFISYRISAFEAGLYRVHALVAAEARPPKETRALSKEVRTSS